MLFSHFGDQGDTVYSLPTVRALAKGEPAEMRLYTAPGRCREPYTAEKVQRLAPLLLAQDYIRAVSFSQEPAGVILDDWRRHYCGNLAENVARAFDLPDAITWEPWLSVEPQKVAAIVVHRSPRYQRSGFPWRRIANAKGADMVFVGSPKEHEDFCKHVGRQVPYHETPTALDLARVIAGSELFIGNQSFPRSIAEGLKANIWVEVGRPANTHFPRPNAYYGTSLPWQDNKRSINVLPRRKS